MRPLLLLTVFASATWAADPKAEIYSAVEQSTAALASSKRIAVLPFECRVANDKDCGQTAAEIAVTSLKSAGKLQLVERSDLKKVLAEQTLSESGIVSESSALRVGELLSAQYLMTGSVSDFMGKRMISIKVLDAEKGTVLGSSSLSLGVSEYQSINKELLGETGNLSGYLFRSAIMPGWGQFASDHPVRGSISLVAFAGLTAYATYNEIQASSKYDDYAGYYENLKTQSFVNEQKKLFCQTGATCVDNEPSDATAWNNWRKAQANALYSKYEDNADLSPILWSAVAGVWAINMIDTYFAGSAKKNKVDLYFSAVPMPRGGFAGQVGFNF